MSSRAWEKNLYFTWLTTPADIKREKGLPLSAKGIAKELDVDYATVKRWNLEFKTLKPLAIVKNPTKQEDAPVEPSNLSDEEKLELFDALLFRMAVDPKSPSKYKELFARRYGLLLDRVDETHRFEVSAEDHSRIREEARRRVSDVSGAADGVGGLLPERALLPDEVRLDTEQEHQADG